jgi:peptidoglycan/LPS O-acetylase OafA/YrhL
MTIIEQQPARVPDRAAGRRYRTEIDGLRALAVALVVVYHVFTGRVSGGVDVFLVLSGFFLVEALSRQVDRTGQVQVLSTLTRTLSRLVPAALLVLAATVVASVLVVPQTRWREIAGHLLSSVTFTENHRLVGEAVDYSASNAAASPMQHFWSLSIQLQVLLVVPVVVAVGAAALRRSGLRWNGRVVVLAAVALVTAGSFAWSVVSTAANQQVAYFSTLPRLWELGMGALVALLLVRSRPPRATGVVLGWGGVFALIACGAVLDGAHRFPGWQAAWPVLCAVAIIVAGDSGGRAGVHRALSRPAARWLGRVSYALYLWHWPVLVLYLVHTGRDTPSLPGAVSVIALSLVLAAVTHRLVERPAASHLQELRPSVALRVVALGTAPLLVVSLGTTAWLDRQAERAVEAAAGPAYPGAAALLGGAAETVGTPDVEPLPPLSVLRDDWPRLSQGSCTTEQTPGDPVPVETEICVLGGDDLKQRIVVVGDSHATQWLPPLADLTERHPWQVISIVRGGCNLSTESEFFQEGWVGYEECVAWRAQLVDRIIDLDPDMVIALGTRTDAQGGEEVLPPGFLAAWQQLSDAGLRVVGMRDSPRHPHDVPDCTALHGAAQCSAERATVYSDDLLERSEPLLPAGVSLLDTSSYFCGETVCPALIGNIWVYLDSGHVTATYMRTVAPLLERDLTALVDW